ncbi:hypothetical protein KRR38_23330 [Novosphingobium sp. G106]|uniref:hypothetical protein n=1 Tax=Novosphingobium sp. G106 TaxID=2849500 RepID=UPI001C2D2FDD|nr:hypothetical protein [Novosphingobium sp. G106]MBV1690532.1 hypothetical protein [Novosphingobium sp. G106]
MLELQIGRYERRIAEEEALACEAISPDIALAHRQVAMLYKSELAIMRRKRVEVFGETLAEVA